MSVAAHPCGRGPPALSQSAPWLCSGSSEGPPWPRASLFLSCPWSPSLLTLSPLLVFRPSWQEPGLLHSLVWIRSGASTRTACRVRGALVRGPHPAQRAFRADAQASFAASFFSWGQHRNWVLHWTSTEVAPPDSHGSEMCLSV